MAIGVHFCYLGADDFGCLVQVITNLPHVFSQRLYRAGRYYFSQVVEEN